MNRRRLAYISAATTMAVGLLGLLNPALTVRLLGLEVVDPRGFSQARATFGGLYLALGAMILWAVTARTGGPIFLRAAAALVGATALGRLASILIDGAVTPVNLLFFAVETAVAVVALLASFGMSETRARPAPPPAPPA